MVNSTKTVVEKLNLTKYSKKLILQKPDDMKDFIELDYDTSIKKDKYDLIFAFVFNLDDFSQQLKAVIEQQLLEDNGYLYFAYPKKNNPKYGEYIDRDSLIQALPTDEDGYVFESSIKFSRMVSLNDVFTVVGLKSVQKKAKKSAASKNSQCVDDYIVHIEDIKQHLIKNQEILDQYSQLTFGYQKDWARYVYSAKRKETQEKRLFEMETVLGEGFKSMELYRQSKR
ncbi:YdeI/OmpD-associated family protein [Bacillus xiapuensis]|uniref:YdeI/OmpD-associated family protein n=1 Tax=Bacillus xiapuensis TaxID=2014075 RepID=A0ABU6N9J4_9BACI|nr:YdeI/OmpD-associated family protein [Bacillus xiapuensis]